MAAHTSINLGRMISRSARRNPGKTALVSHEGDRLTYGELDRLSNRFASGLTALGYQKGDRIATLSLNANELLVAFFGILKIGAVVTPVNVRLAAPEIQWVLKHARARALVFGDGFRDLVESLAPYLPALAHRVMIGPNPPTGVMDFGGVLDLGGDEEPVAAVEGEDTAFLVYTAGTTGRPKGVMVSHNGLLWNCVNWVHAGVYREYDVNLQVFPLYHVAALGGVLSHLYVGATIHLKKAFNPVDVMETIAREGINRFSAAPTVFAMLMALPDVEGYDTRSIRLIGSGAAIMPTDLQRRLRTVFPGAGMFDTYGMSETSGGLTTLTPEDFDRKTACVGQPCIGVELRVVDEDDADVPSGRVGEIVTRSNGVMKGYYNDPEATRKAMRGGWYHTGDLGRLDEEGFLYIVDRKKDMIITGAENVYPREVEEALYTHPDIAEAAVIGVPDAKWGEAIKAVVVVKPGRPLGAEEVIGYCRERIAGYKCPKTVDFVEALPKSPVGKILKRVLRTQYEST